MSDTDNITTRPVVLITGASGLLGSRLTETLAGDYQVVGLDVQAPDDPPVGTDFATCDLTDDEAVIRALTAIRARHGERIAGVVHLAAYYDFSGEPSELYEKLTVQGTGRLLGALHELGLSVEQFLFSSTLLVMQPSTDGTPIDEDGPVEASWPYPESKLKTETLIAERRDDIPAVVLRIAGVYDELGRSPAITEHVKRIYDKALTSWFFPGDATRGQAFVHIDDAIDAIKRCVDRREALTGMRTMLIAEPEAMPYERLQQVIGDGIHGKQWPTIRIPKPVAKAGAWVQEKVQENLIPGDDEPFIKPWMVDMADAHYPVDIARARRDLGWNPVHRLADELPRILTAMRDNPRKWFEDNGLEPPREAEEQANDNQRAEGSGATGGGGETRRTDMAADTSRPSRTRPRASGEAQR